MRRRMRICMVLLLRRMPLLLLRCMLLLLLRRMLLLLLRRKLLLQLPMLFNLVFAHFLLVQVLLLLLSFSQLKVLVEPLIGGGEPSLDLGGRDIVNDGVCEVLLEAVA